MTSRRSIDKFINNPSVIEQRAIEYAERRQELIEALPNGDKRKIEILFEQCVFSFCALSDVIYTIRKWRKPRREDYK